MRKIKDLDNKLRKKRPSADWHGLGNVPRNENLDKIRGPGLFEIQESNKKEENEELIS